MSTFAPNLVSLRGVPCLPLSYNSSLCCLWHQSPSRSNTAPQCHCPDRQTLSPLFKGDCKTSRLFRHLSYLSQQFSKNRFTSSLGSRSSEAPRCLEAQWLLTGPWLLYRFPPPASRACSAQASHDISLPQALARARVAVRIVLSLPEEYFSSLKTLPRCRLQPALPTSAPQGELLVLRAYTRPMNTRHLSKIWLWRVRVRSAMHTSPVPQTSRPAQHVIPTALRVLETLG